MFNFCKLSKTNIEKKMQQSEDIYFVRKAIIDDAPFIADFNIRMAFETEGINLKPEIVKLGVETIFHKPEKGQYFVATVEGQVVASCMVTYEWSDWRCCDYVSGKN